MAVQAVWHVKHHRLTCRRKEITGQQRLLATVGQPRAGLTNCDNNMLVLI
jgi:hypothetical protein